MAAKDVRSELRSRSALNAIGMFALTCLAAVSFSIGPFRIGTDDRPFLLSLLLWLCLFFSAMTGLARVFVKEEEMHTAASLRLAAAPGVVFAGKFLFNALLLAALDLLIVPLFILVMDYTIARPGAFAALVAAGSLALVSATTLVAGIIAKARVRSGLFAVLAFPVLFPALFTAIRGCERAAAGALAVAPDLALLVSMSGALLAISVWLFPVVWEA